MVIIQLILDNSDDSGNENHGQRTLLREQDRFLPIANVAKIMKKALPDNGKVSLFIPFSISNVTKLPAIIVYTLNILDSKRCKRMCTGVCL